MKLPSWLSDFQNHNRCPIAKRGKDKYFVLDLLADALGREGEADGSNNL